MTDIIPTADPFADMRKQEPAFIEHEDAQPYINSLLDVLHEYGTHTRKVLLSPGYGGSFSAHKAPSVQRAMCEYQPLIEHIENLPAEPPTCCRPSARANLDHLDEDHPLIVEMVERLGLGANYVPGLDQLCVVEVTGPYRITEYDGAERVETLSDLLERF